MGGQQMAIGMTTSVEVEQPQRYGRTSEAETYVNPVLVQAAWAAVCTSGRMQARYHHLVRCMGGEKNPCREEEGHRRGRAHPAQIAYSVLRTGTPY
jgi:hypothetical protein